MTRSSAALASLVWFAVFAACGDNRDVAAPRPKPDAPLPDKPTVFALNSQLDLASNLPGKIGSAVEVLIAATDDPDDPTRYLVDQIIAKMAPGTLKDLAQAAEPFVTAYVNQRLLADSPQLLPELIAIGRGFGDAASNLGTMDTLEIAVDGAATHTIDGVRVVLDGDVVELAFADHGMEPITAPVQLAASSGRLTLDRHALDLSLGKTLRLVLDGAIVPHVSPGSVDLVGVLQGGVDCGAFGSAMASALGFGSADSFTGSCRQALTDVATSIYGELEATDADALELDLTGTAQTIDGGNGQIDQLAGGTWTGTVSYAGTPAPLTSGTFTGARVQ